MVLLALKLLCLYLCFYEFAIADNTRKYLENNNSNNNSNRRQQREESESHLQMKEYWFQAKGIVRLDRQGASEIALERVKPSLILLLITITSGFPRQHGKSSLFWRQP